MTAEAKRAARSTSSSGAVTIRSACDLMDDYVSATDLTSASDITVIQSPSGAYRILYLGTSGVMSLWQDTTSDTGWSEESLGAPGNGTSLVCGAVDASGTVRAFAIGVNQAAPDLYVASRPPEGPWSAWSPVAVADSVPPFYYASMIAASTIGGKTILSAILVPAPDQPGESGLWTIDWQSNPVQWTYVAGSDQQVLAPCSVSGSSGLVFLNSNSGNPSTLDVCFVASPFTAAASTLASAINSTLLTAVTGPDGTSLIINADNGYVSGNRCVQVMDCSAAAPSFTTVDTSLTASDVAGVTATKSSQPAIFVIDAAGALNVITGAGAGLWNPVFNLQREYDSVVSAWNQQGNGEILGWASGKGLHRLWQSPPADSNSDGQWAEVAVEYQPQNFTLTRQRTYSTALTVLDASGAQMPDQTVLLRASQVAPALVAGQPELLGPNVDVACKTDGAGRLRITTQTRALDTSTLSIHVPDAMTADETIQIVPNAKMQGKLAGISADDLLKIIPSDYAPDVAQVQQAIQAAMTIATQAGWGRQSRLKSDGRDATCTPIISSGEGTAFRFDVTMNSARFTALTPSAATAVMASYRTLPDYRADGLWNFFEDTYEAIKGAVKAAKTFVATYIVTPVANGISVTLNFVINGITYAFNGIITVLEQAFQVVEMVFGAVRTAFGNIYDFFAWVVSDAQKDIWNTKLAIEKQITATITDLAQMAGNGANLSSTFFAQIANTVDASFSAVEAQLSGLNFSDLSNATLPSDRADGTDTILDIAESVEAVAAWFWDKIGGNFMDLGLSFSFSKQLMEDLAAFVSDVASAITTAISDAIAAFSTALTKFADSSADFLSLALATLVDAAKNLLLLVLDIVDQLVQSFLKLISADLQLMTSTLLDAEISNFLVAGFYNLINPGPGEDVTLQGILSLICAFPVTIIFKALFSRAPFSSTNATPDSLDADRLIASGCLSLFPWSPFDVIGDIGALAAEERKPALAALIVIPFAIQSLVPIPTTDYDQPQSLAKFTSWCMGFVGPWLTFCISAASGFTTGPRGDPAGCGVLCAVGSAALGANIWRIIMDSAKLTSLDIVGAIAGPMGAIAKPLKHVKDPRAVVSLAIVDYVSDVLSGVARIVKGSTPTLETKEFQNAEI